MRPAPAALGAGSIEGGGGSRLPVDSGRYVRKSIDQPWAVRLERCPEGGCDPDADGDGDHRRDRQEESDLVGGFGIHGSCLFLARVTRRIAEVSGGSVHICVKGFTEPSIFRLRRERRERRRNFKLPFQYHREVLK
jgi:hypothetical protein